MKRLNKAIVVIALLIPLSAACSNEHSESCEWEQKKKGAKSAPQYMGGLDAKVGGSSGGRGGGSSGSRGGGSRVGGSSSSGGSGGASKPRFNKGNPAPAPKVQPRNGYVWSWDCD